MLVSAVVSVGLLAVGHDDRRNGDGPGRVGVVSDTMQPATMRVWVRQ